MCFQVKGRLSQVLCGQNTARPAAGGATTTCQWREGVGIRHGAGCPRQAAAGVALPQHTPHLSSSHSHRLRYTQQTAHTQMEQHPAPLLAAIGLEPALTRATYMLSRASVHTSGRSRARAARCRWAGTLRGGSWSRSCAAAAAAAISSAWAFGTPSAAMRASGHHSDTPLVRRTQR